MLEKLLKNIDGTVCIGINGVDEASLSNEPLFDGVLGVGRANCPQDRAGDCSVERVEVPADTTVYLGCKACYRVMSTPTSALQGSEAAANALFFVASGHAAAAPGLREMLAPLSERELQDLFSTAGVETVSSAQAPPNIDPYAGGTAKYTQGRRS